MAEIRQDYKETDAWSLDECADFSGLSRHTISNMFYNEKRFKRAREKGAYIIDAKSFNDFLINGK